MFSGSSASSAHNSLLNAMISSNFSQIFSSSSSTPFSQNASGISLTASSTPPFVMAPPPTYAEAMLNASHQRLYHQNQLTSKNASAAAGIAPIGSPDILRLALDTTAVSLRDIDEDFQRDMRKTTTNKNSIDMIHLASYDEVSFFFKQLKKIFILFF